MIEHGALVDRPLVGDFAEIDRERRIEQPRPGLRLEEPVALPDSNVDKSLPESAANLYASRAQVAISPDDKRRIDQAAAVEIEHPPAP